MNIQNVLKESLKESVRFTYQDKCVLKGLALNSPCCLNIEIVLKGDIGLVMVSSEGINASLLEQLIERKPQNVDLRKNSVWVQRTIYLTHTLKVDVWIISQWLLNLIHELEDFILQAEKESESKNEFHAC